MQESPFSRRHDLLVWKVALAVVAVDAVSKSWALWALSVTPSHLPGVSLQVSLDTNPAPWLGAGAIAVMAAFDLLVLGVLAVLAGEIRTAPWGVAAGLAAGAAASDFIDRLARPPGLLQGALVHWIKTEWTASLNLADSALILAAVLAATLSSGRARGE
jgi:lipoprotein signal peptidase